MKAPLAGFSLFVLARSLCTFASHTTTQTTTSSFYDERTNFNTPAFTIAQSILGAQSTNSPVDSVPMTVVASVTPTTSTIPSSHQTSIQRSSSSLTSSEVASKSTALHSFTSTPQRKASDCTFASHTTTQTNPLSSGLVDAGDIPYSAPSILGAQSTKPPADFVYMTVVASVTPTTSTILSSYQTSIQGSSSSLTSSEVASKSTALSSFISTRLLKTSDVVAEQTTLATKFASRGQTIDLKLYTVTFTAMAALGFRYLI